MCKACEVRLIAVVGECWKVGLHLPAFPQLPATSCCVIAPRASRNHGQAAAVSSVHITSIQQHR